MVLGTDGTNIALVTPVLYSVAVHLHAFIVVCLCSRNIHSFSKFCVLHFDKMNEIIRKIIGVSKHACGIFMVLFLNAC